MNPGDYLFIEFGHSDQKEKSPQSGAYKSYLQRMRYFAEETRNKDGIPVVVTSAHRRTFDNDRKVTNL